MCSVYCNGHTGSFKCDFARLPQSSYEIKRERERDRERDGVCDLRNVSVGLGQRWCLLHPRRSFLLFLLSKPTPTTSLSSLFTFASFKSASTSAALVVDSLHKKERKQQKYIFFSLALDRRRANLEHFLSRFGHVKDVIFGPKKLGGTFDSPATSRLIQLINKTAQSRPADAILAKEAGACHR